MATLRIELDGEGIEITDVFTAGDLVGALRDIIDRIESGEMNDDLDALEADETSE